MNLNKSLIFILLFGFVAQFGVAQQKEEAFAGPDPVKTIHLYPNPAIDYLTVKFEQASLKNTRISLLNVIGNEVEFEVEVIDDKEVKIKVKDLPTGYYFLSVRDEHTNFRSTFKFLKR